MTHEYTLLFGATVLPGGDLPPCEAVAWAHDTILALGSEPEVRAISRGDSRMLSFPGAFVVPLAGALEVGGPADMAVLPAPPVAGAEAPRPIALFRAGRQL